MNPGRDERGQALLVSALVVLALAGLAAVLLLAGAVRAEGERVRGAADLAALAGARAQERASDACAAARAAATLNEVDMVGCRVSGDEVEFVVSVEVRSAVRVGVNPQWLAARAHAGLLTGAPE